MVNMMKSRKEELGVARKIGSGYDFSRYYLKNSWRPVAGWKNLDSDVREFRRSCKRRTMDQRAQQIHSGEPELRLADSSSQDWAGQTRPAALNDQRGG